MFDTQFSSKRNKGYKSKLDTSKMNNSSTSLLQKLNDEKAVLLIPSMVFVGVLMVTGFFGNIIVCYFYGIKTKTTPTSCFILGLAIFDLLSCTISMPMEIVDMRYFYMFPDVMVCKVLRATNFVCTISSGVILIAIATERYRRICLPFRKQITVFQARLICVISALIACVLSWPSLVLYTVVTVDISLPGSEIVQGYDCTTVKDDSLNVYLNAFNIIQILLFILSSMALIVLYALVYRQLIRLKQFQKYGSREEKISPKSLEVSNINMSSLEKLTKTEYTPNRCCGNNTEVGISDKSRKASNDSNMTNNNITQLTSGSNDTAKEASFTREESTKLTEHNRANKHESIRPISLEQINNLAQLEKQRDPLDFIVNEEIDSPNETSGKLKDDNVRPASDIKRPRLVHSLSSKRSTDINTVRYTTLMLVITVTFIVSFLPYLCLVLWRSLSTGYEVNQMTDLQLVVFSIGIRSYFLNSAMNPMIYGFFNSQFREFFTSLCCACCGAKPNCDPASETRYTLKSKT